MPTIDPVLAAYLDQADRLQETKRGKRMRELRDYAKGEQYRQRRLDEAGYVKGSSTYGGIGRTPAWSERDPGAVWNLTKEIVSDITDWGFAGRNWAHLEIEDDDAAERALDFVSKTLQLEDVVVRARNHGGAVGVAIVELQRRADGRLALAALDPVEVWPVAWRDAAAHRLASAVRIYRGDNALARRDDEYPLFARVWNEQSVFNLQRVRNEGAGAAEAWKWILVGDEVRHGFGFCPIFWCPNDGGEAHDGCADIEGEESNVDAVNALAAAGAATTKRNADDTLQVTPMQGSDVGGTIRKGGHNVIFSADAKYLSQNGDSARVCEEISKTWAARVYRAAGIEMINEEEMAKEASGEAKRYRFFRTINTAGRKRAVYSSGLIVPICQALLGLLRRSPKGELERLYGLKTPLGQSSFVMCEWPDPFPPSATDQQALLTCLTTATGGKAVVSQETAVRMAAKAGVPVESVEGELEKIRKDAADGAKLLASAMSEPPGSAGPIEPGDEPIEPGDEPKAAAE